MLERGLSREIAQEIRRRVFDEPGFARLTQVVRRGGATFRISLRPITLRGEFYYQGEMSEGGETTLKNFMPDEARSGVEEILGQLGQRELHLITAAGDLHVRVTRKGRELVSRSAPQEREFDEALPHDRVKRQPLNSFDSTALLKTINIADADGRIKASMRGKYDQINEFLRVLDATLKERPEGKFRIVDAGCGRAYLTLASYSYLTQVRGFDVEICGVDRKKKVVETARRLAANMDAGDAVSFVEGELATADPGFEPDMVVSLHACDTASDEALARGVEWRSRYLLCAPCCQHELHTELKVGGAM